MMGPYVLMVICVDDWDYRCYDGAICVDDDMC